ncbi:hypothetical protein ABH909_002776 [Pseudomonas sp. BS3782 TE3695]
MLCTTPVSWHVSRRMPQSGLLGTLAARSVPLPHRPLISSSTAITLVAFRLRSGEQIVCVLTRLSFTGCQRVGRNVILVELRDLYKGVSDRKTIHAHAHALDPVLVKQQDLTEEHIVSKVDRFLKQILSLEENFSLLAASLGIEQPADDLLGFSRKEIAANGWLHYPQLSKLAQAAPLEMTQQAFLARCKSMHEIWQKLPAVFSKGF